MIMRDSNSKSAAESGFGLIEILVTLVVFSIGVLSIAGLQAISKRNNYDAIQRTTATHLATFIISRIRVNANQINAYVRTTGDELGDGSFSTPPVNICQWEDGDTLMSGSAAEERCTPAQLATYDLYLMERQIDGASVTVDGENAGGLAYPSVCIFPPTGCAAGVDGNYRVVVAWKGADKRADFTAEDSSCGLTRAEYEESDGESYRRVLVLDSYIDIPNSTIVCGAGP